MPRAALLRCPQTPGSPGLDFQGPLHLFRAAFSHEQNFINFKKHSKSALRASISHSSEHFANASSSNPHNHLRRCCFFDVQSQAQRVFDLPLVTYPGYQARSLDALAIMLSGFSSGDFCALSALCL